MVYTPNKDNRKTTVVFLVGIVLLMTLFLLSHKGIIHEVICHTVFLVEAIYFSFILSKFVLPVYTYTINSDCFTIIKTLGKKDSLECNIELSKIVNIVTYKEYKKQEKTEIKSVYNYCANISASSCHCLIFEYSDCRECVMFEPDTSMVEALKKCVMSDLKESQ